MWQAPADLLDLDPDRVLVAIDAHLDDALGVAGRLALLPQRAARAAEVPGLAGGDGFRQRLRIHVRDHQHVAGRGVGRDTGHEPVGVEFRRQRRAFFEVGERQAMAMSDTACRARSRRADVETDDPATHASAGCVEHRATECSPAPRTSVTNRIWSFGSVAERAEETRGHGRDAPGLLTPRTDMQVCSASISTATPCGLSTSSIAVATCEVRCSWVCSRRA